MERCLPLGLQEVAGRGTAVKKYREKLEVKLGGRDHCWERGTGKDYRNGIDKSKETDDGNQKKMELAERE